MYTYYITQNGKLERESSTLYFIGEDFKRPLPAQNLSTLIITSKVSISSWALDYFGKLGILVHFISEDYHYRSSIIPYNASEIGKNVIMQVEHYLNNEKRTRIASEMVNGIKYNIIRNLKYYNKKEELDLDEFILKIKEYDPIKEEITQILGVEGNIWNTYYKTFPKILKGVNSFERKYHPPPDPINALISFGNSMLYATVLTTIVIAGLNPSVSFLHEPSERSFSLALDLADIFKPVIVDRIVFTLVNNRMIKDTDFTNTGEGFYLNDYGRKLFVEQYRDKIETVIKVPEHNKYMSYQSIIQTEAYKILNHIKGNNIYKSFRAYD